ncbi:hypothetical protein [Pseudomonas serbica]|jgi:hypothetical protein|uniref:hypothetical protein n=1 Tax=Pseudomonas serbica TaxID=2965074 RepID=UPI00237B0197|nr:hypothetical protein [Pseudomonas serbica]
MYPLRKALLLSVFALLAACSQPKIDASSDEALTASLNTLYETLPPNESEKLRQDIDRLNEHFQQRVYKGESLEDSKAAFYQLLNGKTPSDVADEVSKLLPSPFTAQGWPIRGTHFGETRNNQHPVRLVGVVG